LEQRNIIMKTSRITEWVIGAVLVAGAVAVPAMTARGQDKKTSGCDTGGREWLSLMDKDHDGTVSIPEFHNYLDAEFKKTDTDHDGTLDAKELGQLRRTLSCRD
jgi:hypothetical protein